MPLNNKKIVVIDDTAGIRTFLKISLQAHGVEFYEAATALEGVRVSSNVKPDLVVLDLGLPDRDGLDIIEDLKRIDVNGHAPKIAILSVRKDEATKEQAALLGADAYMSKPFLMEDFVELLDKTINA